MRFDCRAEYSWIRKGEEELGIGSWIRIQSTGKSKRSTLLARKFPEFYLRILSELGRKEIAGGMEENQKEQLNIEGTKREVGNKGGG